MPDYYITVPDDGIPGAVIRIQVSLDELVAIRRQMASRRRLPLVDAILSRGTRILHTESLESGLTGELRERYSRHLSESGIGVYSTARGADEITDQILHAEATGRGEDDLITRLLDSYQGVDSPLGCLVDAAWGVARLDSLTADNDWRDNASTVRMFVLALEWITRTLAHAAIDLGSDPQCDDDNTDAADHIAKLMRDTLIQGVARLRVANGDAP